MRINDMIHIWKKNAGNASLSSLLVAITFTRACLMGISINVRSAARDLLGRIGSTTQSITLTTIGRGVRQIAGKLRRISPLRSGAGTTLRGRELTQQSGTQRGGERSLKLHVPSAVVTRSRPTTMIIVGPLTFCGSVISTTWNTTVGTNTRGGF